MTTTEKNDGTCVLAHLSDVHLGPLDAFEPNHWNVKRILGYLNWHAQRKRRHSREVLQHLVDDLKQRAPDHIAVTGDLVNIGLPHELAGALTWLQDLGAPDDVSVVPGNHDIYVPLFKDQGVARWQTYMTSDARGRELFADQPEDADVPLGASFPFVRIIKQVAIIGVNSAIPTPVFRAYGRMGAQQRNSLADVLMETKREGLVRVVLIHHPPLVGLTTSARGLLDAQDLEAVLDKTGVDLVLHGHNHTNTLHWGASKGRPFPVIGIASGSESLGAGLPLARYNLVRISGTQGDVKISVTARGIKRVGCDIATLDEFDLSADAKAS